MMANAMAMTVIAAAFAGLFVAITMIHHAHAHAAREEGLTAAFIEKEILQRYQYSEASTVTYSGLNTGGDSISLLFCKFDG